MTAPAPPGAADTAREPVDLRLAVGAAAGWLAVRLCAGGSAATALGLATLSAGGAAIVLLMRRRVPRAPVLALPLLCTALVLVPLAGRIAHARASPLTVLASRRAGVTVTVRTSSDPVLLASAGPAGLRRVAVEARAVSMLRAGASAPADGKILIIANAEGWIGALPGQRARVVGQLAPALDGGALQVTLFARAPPELIGRAPWWQRSAGSIRAALRRASGPLPAQERGLLPALIDGDTSGLDSVLAAHFRVAGLTHLVAVSGTNCSIVLGAVLFALRRTRIRPWLRAVLGAAVLLGFVVVARPSPSVLRAAGMAVIALVSLATGRPAAAVPGLAAVVLALLLWDPLLGGSASFAMSVLATAALLLIAPAWARGLQTRRVPAGLAGLIAVAAAAHLVTAPVVAAISGRVSLVAVPANVLAEPAVAVTTVLGFAAALVAPWWPGGGVALAWLAGWPCRWLVSVADFFGTVQVAQVRWPSGTAGAALLLALTLTVAVAALHAGLRRALLAAALTAAVVVLPVRSATSSWPPPNWIFVACDVGQGDALLLSAGPGAAVLVDTGPDPVAVDRCLREFGITHIPLLVLSHFHLDHVGGLVGVQRGRVIDRVFAGPLDEPAAGSAMVHHIVDPRHVPVLTPPVGYHLDIGAVHLDVLGPASALHGTRSDPNNSSLVLRATVRGIRVLLPGDAEIEEQRRLLEAGVDLRADVLKVPHHGSAYSDPDFLAAVHARLAVVSVGLHNDYGHPSPTLLNEMVRLGVPLLRTDHDGDVAVSAVDGEPGEQVSAATHHALAGTTALHEPQRRRVAAMRGAQIASDLLRRPSERTDRSAPGARMSAWHRVPSTSTTCPSRSLRSCCWSATRSCWSTGQSARSPPVPGAPTGQWSRLR